MVDNNKIYFLFIYVCTNVYKLVNQDRYVEKENMKFYFWKKV